MFIMVLHLYGECFFACLINDILRMSRSDAKKTETTRWEE
jgi:hypothetical protein